MQQVKLWRKGERIYCLYLNLSMLFRGRYRTLAIGGEWPGELRHAVTLGVFQVKPHRRLVGLRDPTSLQGCW